MPDSPEVQAATSHLPQLILASASPRRRELLQQLRLDPWCLPASVDESAKPGESPDALVARLSALKALAIDESVIDAYCSDHRLASPQQLVVLGADTVIDLDGQIIGKPANEDHAVQMLCAFSNKSHRVVTGVSVHRGDGEYETITVASEVHFASVSERAARDYWQTGEPQDKAGGYAIQGLGARFISHLSGSYSNVVGLPLFETAELLEKNGLQDHV